MLTQHHINGYDPKKLVRLKALRPLFANQKRQEVDEVFSVPAEEAGAILASSRATFENEADRPLVFKQVEVF